MKLQEKSCSSWFLIVLVFVFSIFLPLAAEVQATTGSIKGTVSDNSNPSNPIPNLWVDVYDSQGNYINSDRTDATGSYEILNLQPCSSCYKVNYSTYATGYASEWYNNKADVATADPVSVTADIAKDLGNTVLASGGSISGTVTAGGSGLQNVYVYVYDTNGTWVTTATASGTGSYIATGLSTGDYKLQFVPPSGTNYASEWYDNKGSTDADSVHVDAPAETKDKNAVLDAAAGISGTVTDGNGNGIAGARIDVYDSSDPDPVTGWLGGTTIVNSDGSYTVTGLPTAKNYKVQFFEKVIAGKRSGMMEWHSNTCDFDSAAEVQAGGIVNAVLDRGISGNVVDKKGAAVAGALIRIYDSSSQTLKGTATTAADGSYIAACLPIADSYKVQFSPMSWYNGEKSFADANSVDGGSSGIDGIFEPPALTPIYDLILFKKRCKDANGIRIYCN